jgi:hypothetical protein
MNRHPAGIFPDMTAGRQAGFFMPADRRVHPVCMTVSASCLPFFPAGSAGFFERFCRMAALAGLFFHRVSTFFRQASHFLQAFPPIIKNLFIVTIKFSYDKTSPIKRFFMLRCKSNFSCQRSLFPQV